MMSRGVRVGSTSLLAVLLLVAAACSVEDVMEAPMCEGSSSVVIVAQSVPTAEQVPCFEPLPAGWEFSTVRIDQGGTAIEFDSDRAGSGAAQFRYVEACDRGDAVAVPSDQEEARRYEMITEVEPSFQAQRYYAFAGGCIHWDFDFSADAAAALSIELGDTLVLISRADLNDSFRETFVDEDL